jgi:hypothetical protein
VAIKTATVDTEDVLSNEKIIDMSNVIAKRQVDRACFKTILEKIGSKPATREKIEWLEEDLVARVSTTAASAATADTGITVTTGHGNTVFRLYDVVRVTSTGEALLVTSVSANSIGVTRSWGETAAATAQTGAQLVIIGNAATQGSTLGTVQYNERTAKYNYTQDQRNPLSFTDTQTDIALYGGGEPEKELVRQLDTHLRSIETTLFYGARDYDSSASPHPRGSCGGLFEFITSNTANAAGALTPAEFESFLMAPYGVGQSTDNKALFVSPMVAMVLSQMYRDKWQPTTAGNDVTYGARTSAFIHAAYGNSIPVYVKREWSDFASSAATDYGTTAFLVDLNNVQLKVLGGRWNQLLKDRQANDATLVTHEYRSVFSLEVRVEASHAYLRGVTSYAAT